MAEKQKGRVRRGLAWAFKPMVNVSAWIGVDNIKTSTRNLTNLAKPYFIPAEAKHEDETFVQAMQRLNLTEDILQKKLKDFSRLLITYSSIALACLLYTIYLAFAGSFGNFLLALVVCFLALAQAFRFHFWIFQIKHKKLGCTISEWYHSKIIGKNNAS